MHSKKIYIALLSIILFITGCQELITDPSNSGTPIVSTEGGYTIWGEDKNDFGFGVFQTADGGYAVVGSQYSGIATQADLILVRFDTDLNPISGSEQVLTNTTFTNTTTANAHDGTIEANGATDLKYSDTANDFIQTADGGFAIVGQTFNGIDFDVLVVKYIPDGSTNTFTQAWSEIIDGSNGYNDNGNSIRQTEDGGFIICGTSFDGNNEDIMLWKINVDATSGAQIPTVTEIYNPESITDNGLRDFGNHAEQTIDGGYVIVSTTASDIKITKLIYDGTATPPAYILDTNFSGDGEHILTQGDEGNFIQQTSSGDYIVAGNVQTDSGAQADVVLFIVPGNVIADGTGIVTSVLGGSYNDNAASIIQTNDGGYAFTGSKYTDTRANELWVVKLTPELTTVWEKTYGSSLNDNGASIKETDDGGFIVAGSSMTADKQSQFILLKVESNGCVWDDNGIATCGN